YRIASSLRVEHAAGSAGNSSGPESSDSRPSIVSKRSLCRPEAEEAFRLRWRTTGAIMACPSEQRCRVFPEQLGDQRSSDLSETSIFSRKPSKLISMRPSLSQE